MIRLKSLFKKVFHTDIVKVFSLTSITTLVRMVTGFISVKVVAAVIGPTGVALLGQLNNFSAIVMQLATGGINQGITKYVSEYKEDKSVVAEFLSTALRIIIVCSLIVGLFMLLFHNRLSIWIMLNDEYGYVFIIFGMTIIMYALNGLLLSVVNGFKAFKLYVKISVANCIVGLLFTLFFVFTMKLKGALISAVTYQSVMFFITIYMLRRESWFHFLYFKRKLSKQILKKYFQYTLMALTTALTAPIVQLILRRYVIAELSMDQAGWWEAMNRISGMYLMIITSSFSVYYLPRLSEIKDKLELRREIFKSYAVIIPMLIIGFLVIFFLRVFIIRVLFTKEFLPMEQLFVWQLCGDFFKIAAWLLSFLMLAKSRTKLFISTEVIFSIIYCTLGILFVRLNGVVGITQAYLIDYMLYFSVMVLAFRKILFVKK